MKNLTAKPQRNKALKGTVSINLIPKIPSTETIPID